MHTHAHTCATIKTLVKKKKSFCTCGVVTSLSFAHAYRHICWTGICSDDDDDDDDDLRTEKDEIALSNML